jgi:hypothetical protein
VSSSSGFIVGQERGNFKVGESEKSEKREGRTVKSEERRIPAFKKSENIFAGIR